MSGEKVNTRLWIIIGASMFAVLVFFLSAVVVLALLAFNLTIKKSEPYAQTWLLLNQSPKVVETIGTPIKPGLLAAGNIEVSGPSGHADLSFPIEGPKGKARVYVKATKEMGVWKMDRVVLDVKTPTPQRFEIETVQ